MEIRTTRNSSYYAALGFNPTTVSISIVKLESTPPICPLPATSVAEEILELKRDRRAILLAHHYQEAEIQELADFVGDSLELARKAREAEGDVIAFCGVWFMAETAKGPESRRASWSFPIKMPAAAWWKAARSSRFANSSGAIRITSLSVTSILRSK